MTVPKTVERDVALSDLQIAVMRVLWRQGETSVTIAANVSQSVDAGREICARAGTISEGAAALGDRADGLYSLADRLTQAAAQIHDRSAGFVRIAADLEAECEPCVLA